MKYTRQIANRAPKSTTLRLETLESRELLDVGGLSYIAPPPLEYSDGLFAEDETSLDLSSAETLATNSSTTWLVSSTADDISVQGTLRYAITNAENGDTITFAPSLQGATIVLNGTQLEINKSITIDASALADGITIDADAQSRVFYVGENLDVIFDGITITNGNAVGNNVLTEVAGGGVLIERGGNGIFTNCSITNNAAKVGAGVVALGSQCSFTNCFVVGNIAEWQTAGVVVYYGTGSFTNCVIANNAISNGDGDMFGGFGMSGGIAITGGEGHFINCSITDNSGVGGGGVAVLAYGSGEFTNCTIANNTALYFGGGVLGALSNVTVNNSVFALNSSEIDNPEIDTPDIYDWGSHTLSGHNALSTFTNWTNANENGVVNYVYNPNLPLFADAANGDYSLTSTSQATNFGDAAYVATDVDLAGKARVANGIVDLGAYEYQGSLQLARPTLTATKTAVTITLNWDAIPHVKTYTITYRQMGSETEQTANLGAAKTSYTLRNLEPSKSYYITIRANGDDVYKTSQQSATLTVKTNPMQQLDRPSVTAVATSATTINVSWDSVENAKSYTISYRQMGSETEQTATLGATKTNYTLRNLEPSKSYYIKVRANGDALEYQNSPQSATQTVKTLPIRPLDRPALTATETTANSITVAWEPIANAGSYTVSYAVKSSSPVYQTLTYGASKTGCVIRNLESGTSYYIKVRANATELEYTNSPQSPTITAKTLAAESNALVVADYAVVLQNDEDDYAFDATLAELADDAFEELFEEAFEEEFQIEFA